ncbi:hypothetical protein BH09MYX1_BH09MYX1_02010 [soil metagenome]
MKETIPSATRLVLFGAVASTVISACATQLEDPTSSSAQALIHYCPDDCSVTQLLGGCPSALVHRKLFDTPCSVYAGPYAGEASCDEPVRTSTCGLENRPYLAPCALSCTGSSSCGSSNYCASDNGTERLTCSSYGVCDRGTCGAFCSGGTLGAVRQCSATCTAGGGVATTCGALGYYCIGDLVTGGGGTPLTCAMCSAATKCSQTCTDANGANSTCEKYDCTPTVTDVRAAIDGANVSGSMFSTYDPLDLVRGTEDAYFEGNLYYHLQGVQKLYNTSVADFAFTAAVDTSDNATADLFFMKFSPGQFNVTGGRWAASDLHLNHPGGIQALGKTLVVPSEAVYEGGGRGEVVAIDTSLPSFPKTTLFNRTTNGAGTVGVTYLPNLPAIPPAFRGKGLMLVSGAASKAFDVYTKAPSSDGRMMIGDVSQTQWLQVGCYSRDGDGTPQCPTIPKYTYLSDGDVSTDSYQSTQLVTQPDGALFLLQYVSDDGDNRMDLWRVQWPGAGCAPVAPAPFCLIKASHRQVNVQNISSLAFNMGSGVYIDARANTLTSYATDKVRLGSQPGAYVKFNSF